MAVVQRKESSVQLVVPVQQRNALRNILKSSGVGFTLLDEPSETASQRLTAFRQVSGTFPPVNSGAFLLHELNKGFLIELTFALERVGLIASGYLKLILYKRTSDLDLMQAIAENSSVLVGKAFDEIPRLRNDHHSMLYQVFSADLLPPQELSLSSFTDFQTKARTFGTKFTVNLHTLAEELANGGFISDEVRNRRIQELFGNSNIDSAARAIVVQKQG